MIEVQTYYGLGYVTEDGSIRFLDTRDASVE